MARSPESQRDRLAREHFPAVARIAYGIRRSRRIPIDDLISDGAIGLLRAAELYQPQRGVPFLAFARPLIRCAMIDGMRRWRGRGRQKPQGIGKLVGKVVRCRDMQPIEPPDELARQFARDAAEIARRLPRRQAEAVRLRFHEGLNLAAVGARMGITESGACQLLIRAGRNLRRSLTERKKTRAIKLPATRPRKPKTGKSRSSQPKKKAIGGSVGKVGKRVIAKVVAPTRRPIPVTETIRRLKRIVDDLQGRHSFGGCDDPRKAGTTLAGLPT